MDSSATSLLWDFLSFRVLMTPAILVVVYYFGAITGPLAIFWFMRKIGQATTEASAFPRRGRLRGSFTGEHKGWLIAAGIVMLVLLEIFWRMIFEFFIAYFQIHNALMGMGS